MPINEYNEYGEESGGGLWYYKQDKPGTEWFDFAENDKGWTVDFNLQVSDVNDSINNLSEDTLVGAGVYVNDGVAQESITFLTQEIIFGNANNKVVFDTTAETDYRLLGKGNGLQLFAREADNNRIPYSLIAEAPFHSKASLEANASSPAVAEDIDGNYHTVWMDDGNKRGQVFYSKFTNNEWSVPELVSDNAYGSLSPKIIVDNDSNIYVAYEYQDRGESSIALVYKNDLGWSNPYLMGTEDGAAKNPDITFDSQYNVFVVWQDFRFASPEIYVNKLIKGSLSIGTDRRVTNNSYIVSNPSVSSYLDEILITYTEKAVDGDTSIKIVKYSSRTDILSAVVALDASLGLADFSDVLVNSAGEVIVVWQDILLGRKGIYASILNINLDIITSTYSVTDDSQTNGGCSFPVLSEQSATGDTYILWQDYLTDYTAYQDADEYDPYNPVISEIAEPLDSALFYAIYGDKTFHSSGSGESDTQIDFQGATNASKPSVPILFTGSLPILYEAYNVDTDGFLYTGQLFRYISSYHLLEEYSELGPFAVSGEMKRKEIRFGDYSKNLNIHYIFKNFKYYLEDAVLPYYLQDVSASDFSFLETLNAHDVAINNYGDVWMVGTCGMFYYIGREGRLVLVGPDEGDEITTPITGNVKSIGFDKYNTLHAAAPDGIYASSEQVRCYTKVVDMTDINVLTFDKNNDLFFGKGKILYRYTDRTYASHPDASPLTLAGTITAIEVDDNNIVWVGTTSGLYRVFNDIATRYTTENGLLSNRVNDIAIRNTAIRYIATATGISKMIGSSLNRDIRAYEDAIWNENVKSVMWQEPNVLWAGTLSQVNQILINDTEETYETFVFEPVQSQVIKEDDLQQYYILLEDIPNLDSISTQDILEVYINGTLIHHGYKLGSDRIGLMDISQAEPILLFETPLQHDDVVEVVIRSDLRLKASFEQTAEEKILAGERLIRIKDLDVGEDIYIITEGDENEVKVNDINTELPFDKVHLDTTPPTGTIEIPDNAQVNQTKIQVNITGTDVVLGVAGSGVSQMIVSNFENFTTDGFTPQLPVPFATRYEHDLGSTVQNITFTSVGDGTGTSIRSQSVKGADELLYTTSNPGRVYKYDSFNEVWNLLFSYEEDNYVDFIVNYSTKLIVSVGHDTDLAKLYTYEYQYDSEGTFTGYSTGSSEAVSESRIHSYQILHSLLYIGTGKGTGTEYSEGTAPNGGKVYFYDEFTLTELVNTLGDDVYDFAVETGSDNLIAATGESGFVYEIDTLNKTAFPVHNDVEPLISSSFVQQGNDGLVFIGGRDDGTIRRSKVDSNSYDISFRTTPGAVSALKVFPITKDNATIDTMYASVGNVLYYLSTSGAWVWVYTHNAGSINDITFNSNSGFIHLAVDTGVVRLAPATQDKNVYLQLIDRAGNQTILLDDEGVVKTDFTDSIAISDLVDFVNENKIFELDELGNTVFTLRGSNSFFSADRVEQELGVYTSEIFDGTNDLIKWEEITWLATEMAHTEVKMYVRTSSSKNDILLTDWIGPYNNTQAAGVDISHFSGQFIQFKIELISNVKNVTPTFHKATIKAITSEAVHFFTTNFALTGRVHKGILTSQKMVPVSADVVFGINTTDSVDWNDYQIVDENRIFNVNQIGENVRVGIKLLSPSRDLSEATAFDEYGPYSSDLYVNTIDFLFLNSTGTAQDYHFKITLYEDINLENEVYSAYSFDNQEGFNANGEKIDTEGVAIPYNSEAVVLFTVPGSANIKCNTYYFVKIESISDFDAEGEGSLEIFSDDASFIASCSSSFVDVIDYNFTNNEGIVGLFDFRIRFYNDPERTSIYKTVFSQNDRTGWFVDDVAIPESGISMNPSETVNIVYRPDLEEFETGVNYYLSIDAWENNQAEYVFSSNSYTFQSREATSLIYCGGYVDVPVVKNFGIMLELEDNQFVTLNL